MYFMIHFAELWFLSKMLILGVSASCKRVTENMTAGGSSLINTSDRVYVIHALWIWALLREMSFGMFSSSRLTCGPRCWTSSLIAPHGLPVCSTPGLQQSTPTVSQKPVCTCLVMKNRFVFWQPSEFPELFKSMNYIIAFRVRSNTFSVWIWHF